jgi:hypothetical protein
MMIVFINRLPPGTFTTSAHSDEWKIANALSAGPASITDHATVIDWPANPKDGMPEERGIGEVIGEIRSADVVAATRTRQYDP